MRCLTGSDSSKCYQHKSDGNDAGAQTTASGSDVDKRAQSGASHFARVASRSPTPSSAGSAARGVSGAPPVAASPSGPAAATPPPAAATPSVSKAPAASPPQASSSKTFYEDVEEFNASATLCVIEEKPIVAVMRRRQRGADSSTRVQATLLSRSFTGIPTASIRVQHSIVLKTVTLKLFDIGGFNVHGKRFMAMEHVVRCLELWPWDKVYYPWKMLM